MELNNEQWLCKTKINKCLTENNYFNAVMQAGTHHGRYTVVISSTIMDTKVIFAFPLKPTVAVFLARRCANAILTKSARATTTAV